MTANTSSGLARSACVGVGYLAKNAEMVLCLTSQLETCVSGERDGRVVN